MKRIVILTFDDADHEHVRVDWQAKTQGGLNLTPYAIHDVPPDGQLTRDIDAVTTDMALVATEQKRAAGLRLRAAAGLDEGSDE